MNLVGTSATGAYFPREVGNPIFGGARTGTRPLVNFVFAAQIYPESMKHAKKSDPREIVLGDQRTDGHTLFLEVLRMRPTEQHQQTEM